ncbi:MAG: DUF4831 family protein [Clostridium sp.]|nr:DUF4831 family protein [Clostridium sp.]
MKKTIAISALATLLSLSAHAQTDVSAYRPGVTLDGVTYFLPKTALRITVTAEKSVYTPGDFNKYADRFLRLKQVSGEAHTLWTIKHITVEPYGVPDPGKVYSIKLNKRTVAPNVTLSEEGILLAINTEGTEEVLPPLPARVPAPARPNPRDYMNQEMLTAGSTLKIAELVAQEIYDIRDSRNALVRGEADNTPKDGPQLKLMLDQLNMQETALTSLFKGTTDVSTEVFSLDFIPEEETERTVLFRFSQRLGLVDTDDLAGEPVYICVKDLQSTPAPTEDEKIQKKKQKMETGVYYNIPGRASIRIFNGGGTTFCTKDVNLGQFGNTEILSNVLFDKQATTQVTFFQSNGGVEAIKQ